MGQALVGRTIGVTDSTNEEAFLRVAEAQEADMSAAVAAAHEASDNGHRVEGYIAKGKAEGATLAAGGGGPAHLGRGYYVEPTVFGNVDNSSTIAQEEIFGPCSASSWRPTRSRPWPSPTTPSTG